MDAHSNDHRASNPRSLPIVSAEPGCSTTLDARELRDDGPLSKAEARAAYEQLLIRAALLSLPPDALVSIDQFALILNPMSPNRDDVLELEELGVFDPAVVPCPYCTEHTVRQYFAEDVQSYVFATEEIAARKHGPWSDDARSHYRELTSRAREN